VTALGEESLLQLSCAREGLNRMNIVPPTRRIFLGLALFVCLSAVGGAAPSRPNDAFAAARKIVTQDGIQEERMVSIGGIQQWITVRGRHKDNPLLLFLHGGPGFTSLPVSYFYMRDWEEYFTVVQWDQRGGGKTYAANSPALVRPTLSIERVVDDADELTKYLCATYGKKRLVLVAHSWGTIIGSKLALRHPERFFAYVGTGQFVQFNRSEALGYQATLAAARSAGNSSAVSELEAMAPFPDVEHPERNLTNLPRERIWLATYDGYYWRGGFGHGEALAQFSPDYTAAELKTRNEAMQFSNQILWGALGRVDLTAIKHFDCPVVFMHGRHDLGTSAMLLGEWYNALDAPSKKLVWFEDSAHMAFEEEPGKFLTTLVNDVLPLTKQ
jgi:pimeloyl-ACP methyl ester carboxylesterase